MIIVQKYNNKLLQEWDSFIDISNNGTIFQKQSFLLYHKDRKFKNCSLIVKYKEQILAVIPAAEVTEKKSKCFYSHPGSSYGGIVTKSNISFQLINEIIIALENYLKKNNFSSIFIINSPKIYSLTQNDSLEYLLQWHQYNCEENYISHAVSLHSTATVEKLLSKRKSRYIQNNKKLQKIKLHKIDNTNNLNHINIFYDILTNSKKTYDIKPTHSLEELIILLEQFPDNIELYISLHQNQIIGGYLIFHTNQNTSMVFYNVIMNKAIYKQVAMLQLYHSMKLAKEKNQQFIDFGVSHIPKSNNPLEPKFSLIQFKEQFGAAGVQRTAYYKEL